MLFQQNPHHICGDLRSITFSHCFETTNGKDFTSGYGFNYYCDICLAFVWRDDHRIHWVYKKWTQEILDLPQRNTDIWPRCCFYLSHIGERINHNPQSNTDITKSSWLEETRLKNVHEWNHTLIAHQLFPDQANQKLKVQDFVLLCKSGCVGGWGWGMNDPPTAGFLLSSL